MNKYLFIILINIFYPINSFDWKYYVDNNPSLNNLELDAWYKAFAHYRNYGIKDNLKSSPFSFENTNFNWEYYTRANGLNINNKNDAIQHYKETGRFKNLKYCESFNIVIALHLYNISFINEFIKKINHFVHINNENNYNLIITLPIDINIDNYYSENCNSIERHTLKTTSEKDLPKNITLNIDFELNDKQIKTIKYINKKIKNNLYIKNKNINLIICENRGADIGGFLLTLNHLKSKKEAYNFIVKLHTKSDSFWRNLNSSFMNIHINNILSRYECIYSNNFYSTIDSDCARDEFNTILSHLNLAQKDEFTFCAGTMFIASSKFVNFFQNNRALELYNMIPKGSYTSDGKQTIVHGFERFFGYVMDYLNLSKFILEYQEPLK